MSGTRRYRKLSAETVGTYYVTCPYCGYKLDKPEPFFPLSLD